MSFKITFALLLVSACFINSAFATTHSSRGDGACGSGSMSATQYSDPQTTASGQSFQPDGLTAAHRTLPFGTTVRITNPNTGLSTVVTINDRGPFTSGRDIDLSRGAARAIGMGDVGVVCSSDVNTPK